MASADTVREKLGGIYVAAEELPDIPGVPRQAYVARAMTAGWQNDSSRPPES